MPIRSVSQVKKRLDKYSKIEHLLEQDKKRFVDILKRIEVTQRIELNYLTYLKNVGRPKVSTYYLIACLNWLREKGLLERKKGKYRRKLLFLTDNGRKALQILDDFFSSPIETPELVINLSFDENNEVKVNLKSEQLNNITKTAILSNTFIRDRILELSTALCSSNSSITLSIDIPPIKGKTIIAFLKTLWSFYSQTINKRKYTSLGPLYMDAGITNDENRKLYTEFWKKHLETYLQFQGKQIGYTMFHGEKTWTPQNPLFPLLPHALESLIPIFIKDEEVKMWVEKQLEKDPDWFMPHFFWVKLGFKQSPNREKIESVEQATPPIFHEITSPRLPSNFAKFDSMISYMVRNGDEKSLEVLCMWIARESDWKHRDFYESWRILRKLHELRISSEWKFGEVAKILDAALLEYIINDYTPNFDLQSILSRYLVSGDVETIIAEMRTGKYRGEYTGERTTITRPTVGNLFGEKERAWCRFLKKYYPNVDKSIRDHGSLTVSKKFLNEFAQYWKKEYWEEKESIEKIS